MKNSLLELMKKRRSIRDYNTRRKVTDSKLKQLFEIVKYTPSSYNLQPWEFIVVRSAKNKKRLRACANNQRHVEEASAVIIVIGTTQPGKIAEAVAEDRMKKGTMGKAKKASFDAAIARIGADRHRATIWTTKSTSLAAMSLMLAAQSMGMDSCPLEGFDAECVKKEFAIPSNYEVVMLITLGYRSKEPPERPMRFSYQQKVHSEMYSD